jgi:hypothetical protein
MMATASAAATPASPDIARPSGPSGLSSGKSPVPSEIVWSHEVTECPGKPAIVAAPFSTREARSIAGIS